ncbi:MAG: sensor histidine kinase [Candidatus Binatia bacterium]
MRIARFIHANMERILAEWDAFAATLTPAASTMTARELRDHARQILQTIALDVSTPQTPAAQEEKSKGNAQAPLNAPDTAAQTHAVLRANHTFDINQLAAEYRALRASVLRLWADECSPEPIDPEDVLRFNEAIDQALAESICFFSRQVEHSRDLLLGMLSHDFRTPLNSVVLTAQYLDQMEAGAEVSEAAASLIRSGEAMQALLDDLLDYNRANLGLGIPVKPADVDLAHFFTAEIELQRRANPQRHIELHMHGLTTGHWDGKRLQQVVRNLVSNAIHHGGGDAPVVVTVSGKESTVYFEVKNHGPTIAPSACAQIFEPLVRGATQDGADDPSRFGLGLYIVREVINAHGGQVKVRSSGEETVFAVDLPRTNGRVAKDVSTVSEAAVPDAD